MARSYSNTCSNTSDPDAITQNGCVDWRVATFEPQARTAFGFLVEQGFAVDAEAVGDPGRRPESLVVRFSAPGVTIETSLALGFAGEEGICTTVRSASGSQSFGPTVAHQGRELTKALHSHAEGVRQALRSP
jgi:hypothetical protein